MDTIKKRRSVHAGLVARPFTISIHGCGGTGCYVIQNVVKLARAMKELGHPGIKVSLCDNDTVSQSNVIRQAFSPADVGLNKAKVLVQRYRQFYGGSLDISAVDRDVPGEVAIGCVDTKKARENLFRKYYESYINKFYYDCGNAANSGQVFVSPISPLDIKRLTTGKDDNQPSCSTQQALEAQDLFVNSMVANLVSAHLWNFLRHQKYNKWHDLFFNLSTLECATRAK